MSKHTPGPWIVWNDGHGNLSVRSANERDTADATYLEIATEVGGLRTGSNFKNRSEEQANAHLIAASPDLYEAVAAVIDATRDYLPPDGITKDEFISRVIAATDNARMAEIMK